MTDFIKIFQSFARENALTSDPMQDEMVKRLNGLYKELLKPVRKSWFGKNHMINGLYAWGGVGRGKTMIMDLFYQSLPIEQKRRVHFNIFMLDVHNSVKILREDGKGKDPLPQIAKEIASTTRVLCFDEFQVYDIADAMVLSELFKALFKAGVTVIATSNVAPDDLYQNGLQRARFEPFIPLVKKHMNVLHLDSPTDYRQQALDDDGVYFIQDRSAMQALFEKLSFPKEAKPGTVDVNGRPLRVSKAVNDMGWFEFSELCEKPRAAADYKALCDNYQTVFLNNVPRMGYDRRNECKRFILLIDTLYDAGKKLVMNAETEPQKLYHGDDHAFEFERTISRLLEMQGQEYLLRTSKE